MREGALVGELDRQQLSAPDVQETVFRLAAGLHAAPAPGTGTSDELVSTTSSTTEKDAR